MIEQYPHELYIETFLGGGVFPKRVSSLLVSPESIIHEPASPPPLCTVTIFSRHLDPNQAFFSKLSQTFQSCSWMSGLVYLIECVMALWAMTYQIILFRHICFYTSHDNDCMQILIWCECFNGMKTSLIGFFGSWIYLVGLCLLIPISQPIGC